MTGFLEPDALKPHLYSLKDTRAIASVKLYGKSYPHRLMVLLVQPNELDHSRVAFIASKTIGGAVERNRSRRRLRARMQEHMPGLATGWDLLLIARRQLLLAEPCEVDAAVEQLLRKANLL